MLRGRNCFILGAVAVSMVVINGCWVGSNSDPSPPKPFAAGNSAGATNAAAGATSGGAGAASAGAASAGAPSGGTSAGSGGASPSAGAPAAGSAGMVAAGGAGMAGGGATGMGGAVAAGGAGACAAPTGTHQATALDRSCWVATASDCSTSTDNPDAPARALDGMPITRFSTGIKQTAGVSYTYQLDMKSVVMIGGVKVESSMLADSSPQLQVEVSTNGTTWTKVACGAGAITTDFSFASVAAQFVRLTQFGGANTGWWSIHELNVYGATATDKTCTTPGTGATSTACATPHP